MSIRSKKTPYQGLWIFIPLMFLPSVALSHIFFVVINRWQPQYSVEMNAAAAKMFGFACGILFHFSCWLTGMFKEDWQAVKLRWKEVAENIVVSLKLTLTCYWEDVKSLGLAFWIDVAMVALNVGIFVDALLDYLALRGA